MRHTTSNSSRSFVAPHLGFIVFFTCGGLARRSICAPCSVSETWLFLIFLISELSTDLCFLSCHLIMCHSLRSIQMSMKYDTPDIPMTHGRMDQLDSMGRLGQLGRMSRMGRMLHDVNYSANLTVPRCQIHRETNVCSVCTADQKVHSFPTNNKHGALIDLRARPPQVKIKVKH